jgi:hypothetical protein
MSKIKIPRKTNDLLRLADQIYTKHTELGANSPVDSLDWANLATKITQAQEKHDQAEQMRKSAENLREERDNLMADIIIGVRKSRDLLKVKYGNDTRQLGEFGFIVDD